MTWTQRKTKHENENENENLVSIRLLFTTVGSVMTRCKGFQNAIESSCCKQDMHIASNDSPRGHHMLLHSCRGKAKKKSKGQFMPRKKRDANRAMQRHPRLAEGDGMILDIQRIVLQGHLRRFIISTFSRADIHSFKRDKASHDSVERPDRYHRQYGGEVCRLVCTGRRARAQVRL